MTSDRPTLVLVDGHALAYRAFHALPQDMSSRDGEPTNASFGFAAMLLQILETHAPDHLAVVFDAGLTERDVIYPEYKATRKAMDESLVLQMDRIKEIVEILDIPVYVCEGWEADDVIATLAAQAGDAGLDTLIVTGDTDLFQLVDPHTQVVTSGRRFSDTIHYDVDRVRERFGVEPGELVEWKALTGDTSDNIPGVPGIGAKSATSIIAAWGSVEAALEHTDEITPARARNALIEHADQARLSVRLVRIRRDAPIRIDLDRTLWSGFDRAAVAELFRTLDFRTLLDRLPDAGAAPGESDGADGDGAAAVSVDYRVVDTPEGLRALAERIGAAERFAFDTETTGTDPMQAELVGIALSDAPGRGWYIPVGHIALRSAGDVLEQGSLFGADPDDGDDGGEGRAGGGGARGDVGASTGGDATGGHQGVAAGDTDHGAAEDADGGTGGDSEGGVPGDAHNLPLSDVLNALRPALIGTAEKIAHHMKYDVLILRRLGLDVAPPVFDTMVAAWVAEPGQRGFGLKDLAFSLLGVEMTPITDLIGRGKKQITMAEVPVADAARYAAADVDLTLRLADRLRADLDEKEARPLFEDLEMPIAWVLADMEEAGIRVDPEVLAVIRVELVARAESLEAAIHTAAGRAFNIGSPQQLGQVLFEEMGLRATHKTKTGYSTAAGALEPLAAEHPIVKDVLDWRHMMKLIGTYVDALPALINPETKRIHTSWLQTSAVTGRLSSSDPNLQNIPIRTAIGERIREAFVAEPGNVLLAADYSQIELRILAALSQDPSLIAVFETGGDIHAATAAFLFDKAPADVTRNERRVAKMVNFGTVYGISAFGLSARIDMSREDAQTFIDRYFERYPRVRDFFDQLLASAKERGYVETVLGRRRYFPELRPGSPADHQARQRAEREAINAPLQGSAADITKLAMLGVHGKLREMGGGGRLVLQVHDELVLEVPESHVRRTAAMLRETMETCYTLDRVKLVADVAAGPNWASLEAIER